MIATRLQQHILETHDYEIVRAAPISGGDINQAFLLETTVQPLFLKYNQYAWGAAMLETEGKGLGLLLSARSLAVPTVVGSGSVDDYHYLLLEYWPRTSPTADFWQDFGTGLALMHQRSSSAFGLSFDNYIGSLYQSNKEQDSWHSFYPQERLRPLLLQGFELGLFSQKDLQYFEHLQRALPGLFPAELPALLHGDLWSGNFLIAPDGKAGLIDPAPYFGHREMDIAMTKLFGGFQASFYEAYQDVFPLVRGWETRLDLWQLYPLLVHAILFQGHYPAAVRQILRNYG